MNETTPCIFLVDDNMIYLNEGKNALQHKYTVVTIPSGEKLLLSLKKSKPDLILLDIQMPGMSGYDTIKELKENPETADIPVIFLTGKTDVENEFLGLSLGAVDYITKPFSLPLLLKRIELHLLFQKQKHELREYSGNLVEMVKEQTNEISLLQNAIITWAAGVIEFRDEETSKHVGRVQEYLKILLSAMEESDAYTNEIATWDIDTFLKSALLHDIGKIKIREEILQKKTRLTDDELADIQLHSIYGKMLIETLQEKVPNQTFLEYASTIAYRHHERWDGTGYPNHLKGEEIPLQARMMALADVYDALISERPHRKAFTHEEAIKMISEESGAQFDPDLTALFVSLSDRVKEASKK